jgi:Asp/Glu/hydantoin racemase
MRHHATAPSHLPGSLHLHRAGHAEAVIIGGGPVGNAATAFAPMFSIPVIAPIPAAVHRQMEILGLVRK